MDSIKWCLSKRQGLRIIELNENVSDSYIQMAKDSIEALNNLKNNKLW